MLNILFWSVVSAAFIGPGTVTTAAKSGASFGFALLWALVFSTFACLLLQEAAARITMGSGRNLGQAIAHQFEGTSSRLPILILVVGAIILGAAAYQTGNLIGAREGMSLLVGQSSGEEASLLANNLPSILLVTIGIIAAIALSIPSIQVIAKLLGLVVVVMGVCFLSAAINVVADGGNPAIGAQLRPSLSGLLSGSLRPSFPEGSSLLILGLIGTTIVPYNLFLGSGIANKGQSLGEMRFGLSVAIILGGIISMAVLVVGSAIVGEFSFPALAEALSERMGGWGRAVLGIGLFSAGLTSAITAPLAAAITAQSLFGAKHPEKWQLNSRNFKLVWLTVLLIGVSFGLAGFKPIPAIIIAQALNGVILPFVSIFLIFVINDPALMGKEGLNGKLSNILMSLVIWVALVLGLKNVTAATLTVINFVYNRFIFDASATDLSPPAEKLALGLGNNGVVAIMVVALILSIVIGLIISKKRKSA